VAKKDYIISYDIRDKKRLREISSIIEKECFENSTFSIFL